MKPEQVCCLCPIGDWVGEAATWDAEEESLYWCDINRFLIHRLHIPSGTLQHWFFDQPVVALALSTEAGRLLVTLAEKLIWWWPSTDKRCDHGFKLEGYPYVRFNDGRPDPLGNFWVGSMRNNVRADGELGEAGGNNGVMFRVGPNGEVTQWIDGLGIANTLCWSPDYRAFYTADSLANEVWAYDYDAGKGSISNRRSFLSGYQRGIPDGSAMDAEGYLWNCRFSGGCIVRVAPNGQIDRVIEMPVNNVTTAAFGGPDLKTLFVTSASVLRDTGERLAGSLWSISVDVQGTPEHLVKVS